LVYADDLRADAFGAAGNPALDTPHIDGLAARGTSFVRAYCMGAPHGAVCIPSRAMLHTGRAYFRLDLDRFTGAVTLGEALGRGGYRTFATGKWHNGVEPFERSFQSAENVLFSGMSDHNLVPVRHFDGRNLSAERTATEHSSDLFADSAARFIRGCDRDRPYFCYLAFTAPHDPRDAPQPYAHRHYADLPPLPPNFLPQQPWDIGMLTVRDEVLAPWPRPPAVIRQQLAEYYALIEHMDHALGRVLAAVEARDDGRDTVIVFAADNGLALGSHGLLGKQSVFEHSLRVPLILVAPGVAADATCTDLVSLCDLYPTLLELAGVSGDREGLFGRSLVPVAQGNPAGARDALLLAIGATQRAVTDGRYKLIRYPRIDRVRLFDLASDPHERYDLAQRPEHAARVAALSERLAALQREVGDDAPLTVPDPAPAEIDLTDHPRTPDRWQPRWIRAKYFGENH
jgi:arylsulfatase A-like enzyme